MLRWVFILHEKLIMGAFVSDFEKSDFKAKILGAFVWDYFDK